MDRRGCLSHKRGGFSHGDYLSNERKRQNYRCKIFGTVKCYSRPSPFSFGESLCLLTSISARRASSTLVASCGFHFKYTWRTLKFETVFYVQELMHIFHEKQEGEYEASYLDWSPWLPYINSVTGIQKATIIISIITDRKEAGRFCV